ncbi:dephospho-CoA kinase [Microvirga sp. SRT01]|uniref:Dephospho-CoA kinase n=1 Tax=Sphingomonas longa TaxID=2778730 RepID=A0ABS2D8T7_9SPHN|nr:MULTISPECIES: dephospho-CoA kinase [Alphaproteobacteria]MBM6576933.1 dephospho-CoA kinase [Sphingomonas sp. BT552]MBR7709977.1 dephospho-CoA kinase [Microvirga sp. SRT01]
MLTVGLTGSIGMGKSTVAAMFAAEGVPVFDADAAVHRLQGPAGAVVAAIEAAFPGTTGAGGVDRTALSEAVLGDDAAMKKLEAIVHPAVAAERAAFVTAHADSPLIVFDIPLLFETGGDARVDRVVVVSATASVQRARVLARSDMTEAKFAAILARQLPDADKRARAHLVIATDVTFDETRDAVRRAISCLRASTGG